MDKKFQRVAVLKGGFAPDYFGSYSSGRNIAAGLRKKGYDVVEIDVDFNCIGDQIKAANVDAIFNSAWGKYAEDGKLQAYLNTLGIPYTGSRVEGTLIGRDKLLHKLFMKDAGIPVPKFTSFDRTDSIETAEKRILNTFGMPVILKPTVGGCSIGAFPVLERKNLHKYIEESRKYADNTLVEEFFKKEDGAIEITVGVIEDNGRMVALPTAELITDALFYYPEMKCGFEGTYEWVVPTKHISKVADKKAQEVALKAMTVCKMEGVARFDMMAVGDNVYVLEANPLPGFSDKGSLAIAAQAYGWDNATFAEKILLTAKI